MTPYRQTVTLALTALVLVAAAGCATQEATGQAVDHGPATSSVPERTSGDGTGTGTDTGTAKKADPAKGKENRDLPVRVAIPSLGVDSDLMRLGLNKDGTVQVPPPERGMSAGWYTGAAVPGEPGPAVIIGHNSTALGKAVFHDLKKIEKGAEVRVRNSAGAIARFTVTRTETVSKKAFPTERVYGAVNGRQLRLITCDGAFDAEGHPVDNLIVYATLAR
ncbi:class F sortase [Streptomyces yaizuensis]|uniref:Class F sortase n=1 Tax=Streptomyces yaizuensis TaxID=2989713 RepID=A0ABQ5NTY7_9ACTN|nr:class F sortase [Streptomyces sp. YSPA8]GLF93471.1 class F sortase [Streptomyces sp. YSPA8]